MRLSRCVFCASSKKWHDKTRAGSFPHCARRVIGRRQGGGTQERRGGKGTGATRPSCCAGSSIDSGKDHCGKRCVHACLQEVYFTRDRGRLNTQEVCINRRPQAPQRFLAVHPIWAPRASTEGADRHCFPSDTPRPHLLPLTPPTNQPTKPTKSIPAKKACGLFCTFPDMRSHSGTEPSAFVDLPPHARSPNCMPASTSHSADAKKTGSFARFCGTKQNGGITKTNVQLVSTKCMVVGLDEKM